MEERQFRNKIQWFTFAFSILVVWVHSVNAELYLGGGPAAEGLKRAESLLEKGLGQFAVPGFFMISACLFYRNFCWEKLGSKWRSRFRSLAVPFFLWNGIYYLGYVLASRMPGLTDIVGKGVVPLNGRMIFEAVVNYRFNAVFWYLYQLIWLVALTPVLYGLLRSRGGAVLCTAGAAVCVWLQLDFPLINEDSLLYYTAAAALAVHRKDLTERGAGRKGILQGLFLSGAGALCGRIYLQGGTVGFLVFCRLLIPMGMWRLTDPAWLPEVKPWMKDTFFLYATHFALVRLINKTGAVLFPGSLTAAAALFCLMPWLCLACSRGMRAVLKRYFPRLWACLSGGRDY